MVHCIVKGLNCSVYLWRVERVIILFCYFNCNSIIYIFIFISFVTFIILILSLSFYHSNIRLYNKLEFHHSNFSISRFLLYQF